jgi:hypothetical protein
MPAGVSVCPCGLRSLNAELTVERHVVTGMGCVSGLKVVERCQVDPDSAPGGRGGLPPTAGLPMRQPGKPTCRQSEIPQHPSCRCAHHLKYKATENNSYSFKLRVLTHGMCYTYLTRRQALECVDTPAYAIRMSRFTPCH